MTRGREIADELKEGDTISLFVGQGHTRVALCFTVPFQVASWSIHQLLIGPAALENQPRSTFRIHTFTPTTLRVAFELAPKGDTTDDTNVDAGHRCRELQRSA